MTPPNLIVYDDGMGRFGPLTATRAVFELRSGAAVTIDRIRRVTGSPVHALHVPQRLLGVVRARFADTPVNHQTLPSGSYLLVNGRWLGYRYHEAVRSLSLNQALVQTDGVVVAAWMEAAHGESFLLSGCRVLPDKVKTVRAQERVLIDRPWHILDALQENLLGDLDATDLPVYDADRCPGVTVFGDHPVRVAEDARLMPGVVIDAERGPIVIEPEAVVQPLAVLQGPCYIGRAATVVSHASIRPDSVVGPGSKVGGEVSASIIQAYSNKSHHGYLGDSLVGVWVNLGAGTSTSNLKNTYGPVRVQLDDSNEPEDTGRVFHGAILGDFVRTAVGTRLPTGAVIHTGCMLAVSGWAPKLAMPLGFYDDRGRQDYDTQKLLNTLQRMAKRRGVDLSTSEADLILTLSQRTCANGL